MRDVSGDKVLWVIKGENNGSPTIVCEGHSLKQVFQNFKIELSERMDTFEIVNVEFFDDECEGFITVRDPNSTVPIEWFYSFSRLVPFSHGDENAVFGELLDEFNYVKED